MGQPRKNEERFYLYPMQRVVAVFSDEKQAYAACRQLEAEGFNLSSVDLLFGPGGARLLDAHGARRGVVARAGQQRRRPDAIRVRDLQTGATTPDQRRLTGSLRLRRPRGLVKAAARIR